MNSQERGIQGKLKLLLHAEQTGHVANQFTAIATSAKLRHGSTGRGGVNDGIIRRKIRHI